MASGLIGIYCTIWLVGLEGLESISILGGPPDPPRKLSLGDSGMWTVKFEGPGFRTHRA